MADDQTPPAGDMANEAIDRGAAGAQATADRMRDGAQQAGDALKATGRTMVDGGSSIGLKMIDQAETNAHEAFAAMRRAAAAKDAAEVMRVQSEYLRDQGSRAVAQAREIGELIAQFGRDAVKPLRGMTGGES